MNLLNAEQHELAHHSAADLALALETVDSVESTGESGQLKLVRLKIVHCQMSCTGAFSFLESLNLLLDCWVTFPKICRTMEYYEEIG